MLRNKPCGLCLRLRLCLCLLRLRMGLCLPSTPSVVGCLPWARRLVHGQRSTAKLDRGSGPGVNGCSVEEGEAHLWVFQHGQEQGRADE